MWVELKNGDKYNLAYASKITTIEQKNGYIYHVVYDSRGERVGETRDDIDVLTDIIIPAAPGQEAVTVALDGNEPPLIDRRTVIAWRLIPGVGSVPIPAGDRILPGYSILLPRANGTFEEFEGGIYDSVEQAVESIKRTQEVVSKMNEKTGT